MPPLTTLNPKNAADLLAYRGRGNPLATHVSAAISNCFPGLEFDFRALWKTILEGVELHEAYGQVLAVTPGSAAALGGVTTNHQLVSVNGQRVITTARGPRQGNPATVDLGQEALEWSNSLADLFNRPGEQVACVFANDTGASITVNLMVRTLFDGSGLADNTVDPGTLTQGLCSPWQSDYRECGCYYWAASRPDFVNVEIAGGTAAGHNWMHKGRTAATPKTYVRDGSGQPGQLTYEDLYRAWERELRFVRRGKDSE